MLAETAILIKSVQGTGKGTLFERIIIQWFGQHAMVTVNPDQIFGRFNAYAATAIFKYFNEALYGGDKRLDGAIKQAITDKENTVEEKYKPLRMVKNCSHIVVTSNQDWSAAIGSSDRRFVAFEMSSDKVGDVVYFTALNDWIDNEEGVAKSLNYFLNEVDISDFDPRSIPVSADAGSRLKLDQKIRSASFNVQFLLHLLETPSFRYEKEDKHYTNVDDPYDEENKAEHAYDKATEMMKNAAENMDMSPETVKDMGLKIEYEMDMIRLNGVVSAEEKAGLYWTGSGKCYIKWTFESDIDDNIEANLFLPKDMFYACYKEFCRGKRGGSVDNQNLLARFINGNGAGSKGNVFAKESQSHHAVLPGRKWHINFHHLLVALGKELGTNKLSEFVSMEDVRV